MTYLKIDRELINSDHILKIDCSNIERLIIVVHLLTGDTLIVNGIEAIELVMKSNPSMIEGKRLKFRKNMWIIHNIIGHPLMQIFSLFKMYKFAMWIHDVTIPKPNIKEIK